MAAVWERKGLVFRSQDQHPWMATHAQMPHAEPLEGTLARIYFTCRDGRNRSHIGWLVVDLERPDRIVELSSEPLMAPGPLGGFDHAGIMSSWMVTEDDERRFYTIGWGVPAAVPFHTAIGLATGPADGPPRIAHRLAGPVLDRGPANPFYVTCPCVLRDCDEWRMWYTAGLPWRAKGGAPVSRYTLWHARSADGLRWTPDAQACLKLQPGELAIARPCVVRDRSIWRMWHSYRGDKFGYRIGYAESADGVTWRRHDDRLCLPPAGDGFDSAMTAYPFVFDQAGERWMLYSGDGFGQAGMGLARLKGSL